MAKKKEEVNFFYKLKKVIRIQIQIVNNKLL